MSFIRIGSWRILFLLKLNLLKLFKLFLVSAFLVKLEDVPWNWAFGVWLTGYSSNPLSILFVHEMCMNGYKLCKGKRMSFYWSTSLSNGREKMIDKIYLSIVCILHQVIRGRRMGLNGILLLTITCALWIIDSNDWHRLCIFHQFGYHPFWTAPTYAYT